MSTPILETKVAELRLDFLRHLDEKARLRWPQGGT